MSILQNKKKSGVVLGFFLIFLIVAHYLGWLRLPQELLRSLVIPSLQKINGFSIKTGDNYRFFIDRKSFFTDYQRCLAAEENQKFLAAQAQILLDENNVLRDQLNFIKKSKFSGITAEVVGKEIIGSNQTIIINRGSNAGVEADRPVITGPGIIVGRVMKVEPDISIVRLINDSQSRIGAAVLNKNKSVGVVEGGYGVSLRMNLIPRHETVRIGDSVVTSGLETSLPRGLLIGQIAIVENEPYKPFQQAVLTPATDLNKLSIVSVLFGTR